MAEVSYRQAELGDAADIHALLLTLAPEIPLLVDTLEREEALYVAVRSFARSGETWVVLDETGRIVGFVLAAPVERGRHYGENEMLELRHAGIIPDYRRRGIFSEMLKRLCERMLPMVTAVNAANRSGIDRRLEAIGFRQTGAAGGERQFRWEPGAPRRD
jgi:GNAT superfamily N-acetyltransferase